MQDITARPAEGAHVAGLFLAAQRGTGLGRGEAGIHWHHRLFLGEQDPVALLLRQVAPGNVHVVAQRHQDVALVLAVPRRRPRGDGALADAQRGVGHHRLFGHFIHVAQAMAVRAGALRCVRREVFGVQHRLFGWIRTCARIQHTQQAGQRGHAAHAGAHARGAALLLQRHRRRQAFDGIHVGHAHLVDQAARVRRQRLQVTALRFGVQRTERQRGLAGTGDAGEHHQRVARDVHVDVLQVVFARAANADKCVTPVGGGRCFSTCAHGESIPSVAPPVGRPT